MPIRLGSELEDQAGQGTDAGALVVAGEVAVRLGVEHLTNRGDAGAELVGAAELERKRVTEVAVVLAVGEAGSVRANLIGHTGFPDGRAEDEVVARGNRAVLPSLGTLALLARGGRTQVRTTDSEVSVGQHEAGTVGPAVNTVDGGGHR